MATKRIENKTSLTPSERSMATLSLTTGGETDLLDLGGLALAAIQPSTGVNASLYAFSGSMSSTGDVVPIYNAIGGRISLGSTSGMAGKMIVVDPPMLAAARFVKIHTITSTGGTVAQTTSDTIKLCVTDRR